MRKRIYEIIAKEEASGKGNLVYDRCMLICILTSVIPLCFKQTSLIFRWIDIATVSVFIMDYLLRWITADYKYKGNPVISFLRYPFGCFAIVDLLSILPSFTGLNAAFRLFRLLRIGKAFRALRLLRYSKSFGVILTVVKKEKRALSAVCVMAGGYILLSALIMFQVEPDSFESFFDAIYWAVVTLTTVGYGDIYPVSDVGRIVSMLSSFMGIAIVALPTGVITAGYMSELNKNEE